MEAIKHDTDEPQQTQKHRVRPRKKKLVKDIRSLMEFYLSDANIRKSRMIKQLLEKSEDIELTTFLTFNKLKSYTTDLDIIRKAISSSDQLELSGPGDDGIFNYVKRKIPFDPNNEENKDELENRTIYVENVPRHIDIDWLKTIFEEFGKVSYVALPRFKHSHEPKGFAFIEFSGMESAAKCLQAYGEMGACLPTDLDPQRLLSIKTFAPEDAKKTEESSKEKSNDTKVKSETVDEGGDDPPDAKRPKIELEEGETSNDVANPSSVKKARKRNRNKNKNKLNTTEEKLESDSIQLKILPKKLWRQMRNKYLNLQRENMSKMKKELREKRAGKRGEEKEENWETFAQEKTPKCYILRVQVPSNSPKTFQWFKSQLGPQFQDDSSQFLVRFIDYLDGHDVGFIRIEASPELESIRKILYTNLKAAFGGDFTKLSESEADAYFRGVKKKFQEKKKESTKNKKGLRGRDRLIQLALKVKAPTHIRFDEESEDIKIKSEPEMKVELD